MQDTISLIDDIEKDEDIKKENSILSETQEDNLRQSLLNTSTKISKFSLVS